MKKIVIAMLLLLPLIIVACVLVAVNVISNEAYIAVESVELNVEEGKTLELGLSQGSYQLEATVYPTGAKNKSVVWRVENATIFGDQTKKPEVDENGLVTFGTYCTFDVVATTVEGNKSARVNFYIKSDVISELTLSGRSALQTGDRAKLTPVTDPLDAEMSEITFASSDENIVSVDRNGIIEAKTVGTATITAIVGEITASREITVTAGATKFGTEFCVSRDFDLSEIGATSATAVSGGYIESGRFVFTDSEATLDIGGTTVRIRKVSSDDIGIRNAVILSENGGKPYYIGKLTPFIEAVYLDVFNTGTPEATYETDDANIVAISSDGSTTLSGAGSAVITARSGNKSASITLNVVRPAPYVRLNTVDDDDIRGIAGQNLFGNREYRDGELAEFRYKISVQYPQNADISEFKITVDGDLAYVENDEIIISGTPEGIVNIRISVEAPYSLYEQFPAIAVRNLKVIAGVNCSTYEDIKTAAEAGEAIVLRNDVTVPENGNTVSLKADFYGNGYMLDATNMKKGDDQLTPIIQIDGNDVTVSNVTIRCDDVAKINQANGMSGTALWAGSEEGEYVTGAKVEFCTLENGYYCFASTRADVDLVGCIMRNASNFGIFVPSKLNSKKEYVYSNVTVTNSVMSNIVATAIGLPTQDNDPEGGILKTQSTFVQKGFLDVYNWQDVTSMRMLDREFIPSDASPNAGATNETLKKVANKLIEGEIKKDVYADLRYEYDGKTLIHLGAVTAGAVYETSVVPEFEDERFNRFELEVLNSLNSMTSLFKFSMKPCTLYIYYNDADITPESEFSENAATYRRLRGD